MIEDKKYATESLFSYGTLQLNGVQISTFARQLEGHKDQMYGFSQDMVKIEDEDVVKASGKTHHPIVRYSKNEKDFVEGTVFKITKEELAHADRYEVDAYKRVQVELKSGENAWVYIDALSEFEQPARVND